MKTDNFQNYLNITYHECFPEKSKIIKKHLTGSKPWITNGILTSIRKRLNLYKVWLQKRTDTSLKKYKNFKNKLTRIIRISERSYYKEKFTEAKGNIKNTWTLLNKIIKNNKNDGNITRLNVNDKIITDAADIANKINDYFINVGPSLAKKIQPTNGNFTDFLTTKKTKNSKYVCSAHR